MDVEKEIEIERESIDIIDTRILLLLQSRFLSVRYIGKLKKYKNIPVYDPDREKSILKRISDSLHYQYISTDKILDIFKTIMAVSKEIQSEAKYKNG